MTLRPPTRASIAALCLAALVDSLELGQFAIPERLDERVALLGPGAVFDSLSLVGYVLEVEQRVADEWRRRVSLTDERAMSRRESPFRSVGALVDYLEGLLGAAGPSR